MLARSFDCEYYGELSVLIEDEGGRGLTCSLAGRLNRRSASMRVLDGTWRNAISYGAMQQSVQRSTGGIRRIRGSPR